MPYFYGSSINATPKRHLLVRKHVIWYIDGLDILYDSGNIGLRLVKHGVVLTGRNATGPPRAATWWVTLRCGVLQTTTDARRAKQYWPLHYVYAEQ